MNPSSAESSEPALTSGRSSRWHALWPTNRFGQVLLLFPATSAILVVAVMVWVSGVLGADYVASAREGGELVSMMAFWVLMTGYNLAAPLGLAALVLYAARGNRKGLPLVAGCCVIFTGVLVWQLTDMVNTDDSMAGLLLLILPPILGAIILPFAGVTALLRRT
jgi:hypothetical protein